MARIRIKEPITEEASVNQTPAISDQVQQLDEPLQANPIPASGGRSLITKNNLVVVAILLVILFVAIAMFSLLNDRKQLKNEVNKLSSSQAPATNDAEKYQEEVAKLVDVPQGITPVAKTLSDTEISQLSKDNPIYKSAKNGDVFLLYTYPDKSLFLVIYRPSTHKVVLATLGSQQTTQTPTKP